MIKLQRLIQSLKSFILLKPLAEFVTDVRFIWLAGGLHIFNKEYVNKSAQLVPRKYGFLTKIHITVSLLVQLTCFFQILSEYSRNKTFENIKMLYSASLSLLGIAIHVTLPPLRYHIVDMVVVHQEIDECLLQLRIKFSYWLSHIFAIVVYPGLMLTALLQQIFWFYAECGKISHCFCNIISSSVALHSTCVWIFTYIGLLLFAAEKVTLLNKYLKTQIHSEYKNNDMLFISGEHLYPRRSTKYSLQMIAMIHEKICTQQRKCIKSNSNLSLFFISITTIISTMVCFGYIHDGIVSLNMGIYLAEAWVGLMIILLSAHKFLLEAKETEVLVAEWNLCYHDPSLVSSRNVLILQGMHTIPDEKAGKIFSLGPSLILSLFHLIIILVIFLVQTTNIKF